MKTPVHGIGEMWSVLSSVVHQVEALVQQSLNGHYHGPFFQQEKSGDDDNRLRAILRLAQTDFRDKIAKTGLDCIKDKSDVQKGDRVQFLYKDPSKWRFRVVEEKLNDDEVSVKLGEKIYPVKRILAIFTLRIKIIRENQGPELSIFSSYPVFCNLINRLVDQWEAPIDTTKENYFNFLDLITERAINTLDARESVKSYLEVQNLDLVQNLQETLQQTLDEAVGQERTPMTENHYLNDTLSKLRIDPLLEIVKGHTEAIPVATVLSILKLPSMEGQSIEDRQAIEMSYAVLAYSKVCKKRVIDNVCMILETHCVKAYLKGIRQFLSCSDATLAQVFVEPTKEREE